MILRRFLSLVILLTLCAACAPGEAPLSTQTPAVSATSTAPPTVLSTATPPPTATPTAEPPTPTPEPPLGSILLVFGDRFIEIIYTTVRPAFEDAGYAVVVASRTMEPLNAKVSDLDVEPDLLLADVQVDDYAAVVFLCDNDLTFGSARDETDRIAQQAAAQGVVLAAICSGPRILAYAQVVDGLSVTGEPSHTCQMLEQAGATCTGRPVERAGLIVTARDRYASQSFVREILAAIEEANTPAATSTPAVLLNLAHGQQAFTSPETFQAGLGDLDGDGDLDMVLANPMHNNAQVWLNDGRGTFVDTGQLLTQYGHGVALADFDEDGDLDAFIVCHQSSLPSKVYLNDGMGMFTDSGQEIGDARWSGVEVHLLELNGDGHIDVHVSYYSESGVPDHVYLNDGHAVFSDSGLLLEEDTIAWGDLDGDGDVDYFGKYWGEGYVVRLNDGQGGFTGGWQVDDSDVTLGGIGLADFDGDGDLDALVANGFRETGSQPGHLFWNDGRGQFSDSGGLFNHTMGADLAVGDLDLDGDLDAVIANMDRPNEVWLYEAGIFIDSDLRLGQDSDLSSMPMLGDLDGDGDLDIVFGRFNGGAEIWFNMTINGANP
jgi:putative intracellular protease/amidase